MREFLRKWYAQQKLMRLKDKKGETRKYAALIYALCTWQLLAYVTYVMIKNRIPEDTKGEKFIRAAYGDDEYKKTIKYSRVTKISKFGSALNDSESSNLVKET